LIDLQNDSTAKALLDDKTVWESWIHSIGSYPNVAKVALRLLFGFCFHIFLRVGIPNKTTHRYCLGSEDDIRCTQSETSLPMDKLLKNKQYQTYHCIWLNI